MGPLTCIGIEVDTVALELHLSVEKLIANWLKML